MLTLCPPPQESEVDSGIERRRGARFRQIHPIKAFDPGIARYFGGQTQDVSATGLRLELPASMPVRPGKFLNIHVGINDQKQMLANRRQMIPARIVWVDRAADSSQRTLCAGIEFLSSTSALLDAA